MKIINFRLGTQFTNSIWFTAERLNGSTFENRLDLWDGQEFAGVGIVLTDSDLKQIKPVFKKVKDLLEGIRWFNNHFECEGKVWGSSETIFSDFRYRKYEQGLGSLTDCVNQIDLDGLFKGV